MFHENSLGYYIIMVQGKIANFNANIWNLIPGDRSIDTQFARSCEVKKVQHFVATLKKTIKIIDRFY